MGRYRLCAVMLGAYAFGCVVTFFELPWWISFPMSGIAGWHTDNLARWIGKVKP
jgi:hypothetical protein